LGGGAVRLPSLGKLRIPARRGLGVRRRGISFVVERGTAQTAG
jgi:hypothetical protein